MTTPAQIEALDTIKRETEKLAFLVSAIDFDSLNELQKLDGLYYHLADISNRLNEAQRELCITTV